MAQPITRLVFVFDADSGPLAAFADSAKKFLMLKGCALCTITHGIAGERGDWRSCKEEIGVPIDYHHRDDMTPAMRSVAGNALPCVLAVVGDDAHVLLLPPASLNDCKGSVTELRSRLYIRAVSKGLSLPDAEGVGA